jgi:hypothetical protein
VARSNYKRVFEDLQEFNTEIEDEDGDIVDSVTDTRANHWAVGWVETVYIHESNTAALNIAEEIMRGLGENYPLYDEEDHSELCFEEASEYWERASIKDRIRMIKDNDCGECVSVFAARRDEIPPLDYMGIVDAC